MRRVPKKPLFVYGEMRASEAKSALPVQGTVATIVASSSGDAPSYARSDGIEAAIKSTDSRLTSLPMRCTIQTVVSRRQRFDDAAN